jgi:hypothetical protein
LESNNLPIAGPEDYDQYCNLAENNIFIFPVKASLGYYYRWHPGQATWQVHKEPKIKEYEKIIQEYWKKRWTL